VARSGAFAEVVDGRAGCGRAVAQADAAAGLADAPDVDEDDPDFDEDEEDSEDLVGDDSEDLPADDSDEDFTEFPEPFALARLSVR
jgi:hypothetical protein